MSWSPLGAQWRAVHSASASSSVGSAAHLARLARRRLTAHFSQTVSLLPSPINSPPSSLHVLVPRDATLGLLDARDLILLGWAAGVARCRRLAIAGR
ncbi:hypothetical protein PSPO01_14580 [Paraphaeosphaeria sporulosa]